MSTKVKFLPVSAVKPTVIKKIPVLSVKPTIIKKITVSYVNKKPSFNLDDYIAKMDKVREVAIRGENPPSHNLIFPIAPLTEYGGVSESKLIFDPHLKPIAQMQPNIPIYTTSAYTKDF